MHRFPDGLAGDDFYQKQKPDHFPEWINEIEVHKKGNGKNVQISCDSKPALIYLANQACIVLHTWLSREDDLHRPDRISFDLDPPDEEFDDVVFAAFRLKKLLDEI